MFPDNARHGHASETTPLLGGRRGTNFYGPSDLASSAADENAKCLSPREARRHNMQKVMNPAIFFQRRGTAFGSCSIWLHTFGYVLIASSVCAGVFFTSRRPQLINVNRVSEVVKYCSSLLGFLLVFHLALMVRRWSGLRMNTFGDFSNAVGDLSMLMAAHLPHQSTSQLKALVHRYSIASLELTFMQAQGTDGVLGSLIEERLLTDDEKRKLEELTSKPQAMWIWIASLFRHLAESGKLSSRILDLTYGICARARGSLGRGQGAFAYLDTQVPLPYIHFLSVLVHLNSLAIAIKCGVVSAVALWNLRRSEKRGPVSDTENAEVLAIQIAFVVGIPLLYHAVLEQVWLLSHPFEEGSQESQKKTWQAMIKGECEALQAGAERIPNEALDITNAFEVRECDLVHDVVVAVEAKSPHEAFAGKAPQRPHKELRRALTAIPYSSSRA